MWPTFMQRQVPAVRRFWSRAVSSSTERGLPVVRRDVCPEILQVRLLDQVVSMPVVAVQTVQPVEIPQLQFLDKVVLPVVMQDLFSSLDVQKTVDVPQLQFLTPVVAMPVEIPQGAVLDELFMGFQVVMPVEIPQAQFLDKVSMSVVVSGAIGQIVQETCGDAAGAVLGQGVHARCCRCVWCRRPDSAENCGVSTVAVLGQGLISVVASGADGQTAQKTVEYPTGSQFLDKV